mmetsp:Transcript_57912/g.142060  ORF Transcript_57912/g.142060 Transcript_57912/m.142060 type:complete len:360 (+) Transcript_57912:131-1210(+)
MLSCPCKGGESLLGACCESTWAALPCTCTHDERVIILYISLSQKPAPAATELCVEMLQEAFCCRISTTHATTHPSQEGPQDLDDILSSLLIVSMPCCRLPGCEGCEGWSRSCSTLAASSRLSTSSSSKASLARSSLSRSVPTVAQSIARSRSSVISSSVKGFMILSISQIMRLIWALCSGVDAMGGRPSATMVRFSTSSMAALSSALMARGAGGGTVLAIGPSGENVGMGSGCGTGGAVGAGAGEVREALGFLEGLLVAPASVPAAWRFLRSAKGVGVVLSSGSGLGLLSRQASASPESSGAGWGLLSREASAKLGWPSVMMLAPLGAFPLFWFPLVSRNRSDPAAGKGSPGQRCPTVS